MTNDKRVKEVQITISVVREDDSTTSTKCRLRDLDISPGSDQQFQTRALDKPLKSLLRKLHRDELVFI